MSRHASRFLSSGVWAASCALALFVPLAGAQTIADYSRAQSLLLENAMTQAAARSAGLGAPAPVPAASVAQLAGARAVPAPRQPLPSMSRLPPAVQVSGMFSSSNGAIAEIVVNATPYLLGVGQGVPGTPWHVELVAVDRVVLTRRAGGVAGAQVQDARRIFPLPALR